MDVHVGDEVRPVPGLRRQAILSVLALNAGTAVSAERLIDRLLAGRAHLHAATALAADGGVIRARQELDRARALFASCGAALFIDQADQAEQRLLT
ncbi:hypothetical protein QLQ12_00185 [Actinoplanes sp. NEAU-A12]|uniref:Uncharacterized protein n=1 Tax=Actinoplanes sandaracinus TaxID=3045177 RepID=A0ABT6WBC5_9ACTN|nr:hypothetical protein [Actinoplanes sandaracinus]MDI6097024.1 hypothetical protein [Actinoplanes sandaracinus]